MVDGLDPFQDLKKLRHDKGADIVGLMLDSPSGCGLSTRVGADAEEAFFVIHHACAVVTLSIAHEIGHILGAGTTAPSTRATFRSLMHMAMSTAPSGER
jgi:hypothetical protein